MNVISTTQRVCSILVGDAITRLKQIRTESVHMICTSVPYYGLRDYKTQPQVWGGDAECVHLWQTQCDFKNSVKGNEGSTLAGPATAGKRFDSTSAFCSRCNAWRGELGLEPTIELYVEHIVTVFEELRRVLRKDGSCWLNIGDSFSGSSKGIGGKDHGKAPFSDNNIARTDWKRVGLKPKDLILMPARIALALQSAGWWVRSDIIWDKKAPMPESVTDRPTVSYEHVFLLTKSAKYFYDEFAVREKSVSDHPSGNSFVGRQGSSSKFPMTGGIGGAEWNDVGGSRNLRSVWSIPAEPHSDCLCNACGRYYENPRGLKREKLPLERNPRRPSGWADSDNGDLAGSYGEQTWGKIICECGASDWTQHFAAYPTKLVDRCVKAGTSEKGVCPQCLAPWIRIVEKPTNALDSRKGSRFDDGKNLLIHPTVGKRVRHKSPTLIQNLKDARSAGAPHDQPFAEPVTVGWKQSCKCEPAEPIAATILDPFGGLGTTAISALRLGRDALLIELQPQYARMAEIRVERDAPLFNRVIVSVPEVAIEDVGEEATA